MIMRTRQSARAYTLIEIVLVIGLLMLISAIALPNFYRQFEREQLPTSAEQLRALIILTRANAALDSKRFRIRFPRKEELDDLGTRQQPMVEREDDPMERPDEFLPVLAPWAIGQTLLSDVRCAEIRLGRPSIEDLKLRRESATTKLGSNSSRLLSRCTVSSKKSRVARLPRSPICWLRKASRFLARQKVFLRPAPQPRMRGRSRST